MPTLKNSSSKNSTQGASLWKELGRELWFHGGKRYVALIVLCLGIASALGAIIPKLMADLFAAYSQENRFWWTLTPLGAVFVTEYLNRVIYQLGMNRYIQVIIERVRNQSFELWLRSIDTTVPLGELLSRMISDTDALRELVSSGSFAIIIDFCFVIAGMVSFAMLDTSIGVWPLLAQVFVCLFLIRLSKSMARVFLDVRKSSGIMSSVLADLIAGGKQLFYTPQKAYALKRASGSFDDFLDKQIKSNIWDSGYYSVAESLYPFFLALLVGLLSVSPSAAVRDLGMVAVMVDLIQRSINPIKDIAGKIASIQRAFTGLSRIREFKQTLSREHLSPLKRLGSPIKLEEFHFHLPLYEYTEQRRPRHLGLADAQRAAFTLEDIRLSGKKGEVIGVIGPSGSGKSTFLNILALNLVPKEVRMELHDHNSCALAFEGNPFIDENFWRFRENVGIISQDSHIFSGPVEFNITLNQKGPLPFREFWKLTNESIPYLKAWGIDPQMRIEGKHLSLGQKQILAALRCCYLRTPVMLYDEVSSGLDSECEEDVRRLMSLLGGESLTVIVTHRLETILKADKILFLERGKVRASGIHKDLLESSLEYREFLSMMPQKIGKKYSELRPV